MQPKHSPENYAAFIESALDILKREVRLATSLASHSLTPRLLWRSLGVRLSLSHSQFLLQAGVRYFHLSQ